MVCGCCKRWVVGWRESGCVIVVGEGVGCEMWWVVVFVVFEVGCGEILGGVVIVGLVVVGEGGV